MEGMSSETINAMVTGAGIAVAAMVLLGMVIVALGDGKYSGGPDLDEDDEPEGWI